MRLSRCFAPATVFVLSCLGCGGSPAEPGTPPVASVAISPTGSAIVGVTVITFTAAADPSSQTTYSWNFGDGGVASGQSATHVYDREGTFTAVLTATNRSGSATASGTVAARSVTGLWRPDFLIAPCFSIRLTQNGSSVAAVAINGSTTSVSVQSPRSVTVTMAEAPAQNCGGIANYAGTFDAALDSFTVNFRTPSGVVTSQTDTWRRQ